jgi:hypothetical protein
MLLTEALVSEHQQEMKDSRRPRLSYRKFLEERFPKRTATFYVHMKLKRNAMCHSRPRGRAWRDLLQSVEASVKPGILDPFYSM